MSDTKTEQKFENQGDTRSKALAAIESARQVRVGDAVPEEPISETKLETQESSSTNTLEPESLPPLDISSTEKEARAIGWKSKEERSAEGKDNTYFVEADEYLRRQPLFQRIDAYGKEIKQLREVLTAVPEGLAQIRKEAYDEAFKKLQAEKINAIDAADSSKVFATEAEMGNLQKKINADPLMRPLVQQKQIPISQTPGAQDLAPDVKQFIDRNASWYNANTPKNRMLVEAAFQAQQLEQALAEDKGEKLGINLSVKDLMSRVETRMKINFPDHFTNPNKSNPTLVGRSTSSQSEGTQGRILSQRLSPEQRQIGEILEKKFPGKYTIEKYAQELNKEGRLK